MSKDAGLLKFRQWINGEYWYWGYGVAPDPKDFIDPKDPSAPSEQYVGITDDHARPIKVYVNDIVKYRYVNQAEWRYGLVTIDPYKGVMFGQMPAGEVAEFRIAGNRHENKNLFGLAGIE